MPTPHLRASITFLTTAEGGRRTSVYSGYRGQFHLHGLRDDIADVEWHFPDVTRIDPGDSARCLIWFARPDYHLPKIKVGDAFEIREGKRVVARGTIDGTSPSDSA